MFEPISIIKEGSYNWIFQLGLGLTILLTIFQFIIRIKKIKKPNYIWMLDIIAIIGVLLILTYHSFYTWQLVIVIILLILLIIKTIYHILTILNIFK